ncbi:5'-nucleotidase C-terminal domain-containing protein [Paenibacillus sp. CGMCC 1.16610]|uniref:Multifunctional 2',3'-cyclic-nucleotide 2'-phosphodiesterase/5'-nucleotidase/3'-nucleotidase n=1 Tax=Paenibacillus anseongense TaxID=2682845 RepID=A0ABW9UP29_9BACL|nr:MULTISPECIES: 5'-nucleotidase C-terminal domain-containing protein [Paenibacillus]MBA2943524.1 5'-nucleotidase C-terminal domain-containing protein [Paenibacillus sp. CGMCC 1.16610]MVQ39675.1 multifunctional 2',3'-cyclic-nucleotide 2'-phosphodiesterase/5'-nucleotidase/3'-nucleotidase [Paenibacillus anseongense]
MKKTFQTRLTALALVTALTGTFTGSIAFADTAAPASTTKTAMKSDMRLAIDNGAIEGYGDTDYRGANPATRAEVATMINRAAKLQSADPASVTFTDLANWQKQAVANAVAAKLISGFADGTFHPDAAVTRQELAELIVKVVTGGKLPSVNENVLNYFKDSDSIAKESRPYVAYAVISGIFSPTLDGNFNPTAAVTRDEVAKALKPILFKVVDILTTNDIHGKIEVGFDKKRNQGQGGIETVGGIVTDFRAVNPEGTVVVDGGDAWQGTLISNTTNGQSVMDTMAQVKYDAAAIGNHEFDFGRDVLINNIKNAKFPILGANIIDTKTGERVDWTQPYVIVEKDGLKIGIIGFATPQTTSTTKSTNIEGLSFVDPVPLAKELSAELRAKGVDIIMVTSHLPGEQNQKSAEIISELADLAKGTGNGTLDAIVGGHSHLRVSGIVNGIPVVEAQSWLYAVGHIQLFVDKTTKQVVSSNASLLETYTNLTTADEKIHQTVEDYKAKISTKSSEVEVVAAEPLGRKSFRFDKNGGVDRDGASQLGNSITDAMRAAEKSDIAFTNIGGIRADVDKGDLTYGEMFEVFPFGNYNVTGTMTAEQIKKALEVTDKYTNLPAIQFSGLKVEWDSTKPLGEKYSKITLVDGTPIYVDGKFNTDRTFKVTTNDFMATGSGDGFTVFGEVKDWKDGAIMLDAWVSYANSLKAAGKELSVQDDGRDVRLDLK